MKTAAARASPASPGRREAQMSMTRTVADKAMTDAQLLRHLRRHPHRREIEIFLVLLADKRCGAPYACPPPWAKELRKIAMEIVK